MCGLAGLWRSSGDENEALTSTLTSMIDPIRHRGPDDQGVWVDENTALGLGFRRLAILDLTPAGHQPMVSATGRWVMVFNGEVYNYRELRAELSQKGAAFRGESDTEVILAAVEQWGVESAVTKFIGMFAIALWDRDERHLWLVRDRLGIKPLHVYQGPMGVAFGSELRSLTSLPGFDRTIDAEALAEYLRYLYVPAPRTIYSSVRKLLPGHLMCLTSPADALPEPRCYWSAQTAANAGIGAPFDGDSGEAVDALESLLDDAVTRRMVADVPLGALLSGGIDSSAVVAMMQRRSSTPVKTFSIGFDSAAHDESEHAEAVAQHLGTQHHTLRLDGGAVLDALPDVVDVFDEPFADPSQIPTLLICRLAREQVTVALTGDGGDEIFGGYNRYSHASRLADGVFGMPKGPRRAVAAGIGLLNSSQWNRGNEVLGEALPPRIRQRLLGEKMLKLKGALLTDSEDALYDELMSTGPAPSRWIRNRTTPSDLVARRLGALHPLSMTERAMLADQQGYLADDLLSKVDRVSMAVSLEARVPLLDHRIVEFGWRLPMGLKTHPDGGKWVLREVLYRHVPKALLDRPKVGFTAPVAEWLRGPLRRWAEELLRDRTLADDPLLDSKAVLRTWQQFLNGHENHANALWAAVMYQSWKQAHLS